MGKKIKKNKINKKGFGTMRSEEMHRKKTGEFRIDKDVENIKRKKCTKIWSGADARSRRREGRILFGCRQVRFLYQCDASLK